MPSTGRRRVPLVASLGLTIALVAAGIAPAAAALRADPGAECPPEQHDCSVWDDDPGTPGGPGGGGDNGGGGDSGGGGGTAKCQWNGRPVKCYDDLLGWFDNGTGCYAKPLESPPTPAPEGKEWYLLTCNGGDLGAQRPELLDGPPPGYGAPPDPEELARRALARLTIKPPRIAVAPRRGTGPGLVGLPVWMWGQDTPETFGKELFERESERGLTVEITATFDRIVWDMGNGETVTCDGAGTAYRVDGPRAGGTSPTCGYDSGYPKAGTYRVSATTHWTVTWEGGGQRGRIPVTRTTGTVPIQIDELQVVTR
ncbi:hypothetical protein AB0J20_24610 [Micromonospora costi]|uniref:hypothetical protein n=1 Tax=Micromonospora costi TaxID=1530042 RepID=UPI0033EF6A02